MGSTLGKGLVMRLTKRDAQHYAVRVAGVVAVYSAIGLRDERMNERLGKVLMSGPAAWQAIATLRRDVHDPAPSCWLHGATSCFSAVPQ